jgi:hypothetical protein
MCFQTPILLSSPENMREFAQTYTVCCDWPLFFQCWQSITYTTRDFHDHFQLTHYTLTKTHTVQQVMKTLLIWQCSQLQQSQHCCV